MPNNSDSDQRTHRNQEKDAEINRDARRQRAMERLSVEYPRCIYCGEDDPLVLERHHLSGRAYGEDTIIVCRNHHRKLSDTQKDHPEQIQDPPVTLEAIAHFLLGLADLFELLIRRLREFARDLIDRASPNRNDAESGS